MFRGKGRGRYPPKKDEPKKDTDTVTESSKGKGKGKQLRTEPSKVSDVDLRSSKKMKTAATLSFGGGDSKDEFILMGTCYSWQMLAMRMQTAFNIGNQYSKIRTFWPILVVIDYCSFWAALSLRAVAAMEKLGLPPEQSGVTEEDQPTFGIFYDNLVITNINIGLLGFTGVADKGNYAIKPLLPRVDVGPRADPGAGTSVLEGGIAGRLLLNTRDFVIWRENLAPSEVTLCLLMKLKEITTQEEVFGSDDDIIAASVMAHWPPPYDDVTSVFQTQRYAQFKRCVLTVMTKPDASKSQEINSLMAGLQTIDAIITKIRSSKLCYHFGVAAFMVDFIGPLKSATIGDSGLHNVRFRTVKTYLPRLDPSLFIYGEVEPIPQITEYPNRITYRASSNPDYTTMVTLATYPVRIFTDWKDRALVLLREQVGKYNSSTNNKLNAALDTANQSTVYEEVRAHVEKKYVKEKTAEEMLIQDDIPPEFKEVPETA